MRIGSDVRHFVLLKLDLRSCNCLFKLSLRCFEIFIEIELDIGWGNSHSCPFPNHGETNGDITSKMNICVYTHC